MRKSKVNNRNEETSFHLKRDKNSHKKIKLTTNIVTSNTDVCQKEQKTRLNISYRMCARQIKADSFLWDRKESAFVCSFK